MTVKTSNGVTGHFPNMETASGNANGNSMSGFMLRRRARKKRNRKRKKGKKRALSAADSADKEIPAKQKKRAQEPRNGFPEPFLFPLIGMGAYQKSGEEIVLIIYACRSCASPGFFTIFSRNLPMMFTRIISLFLYVQSGEENILIIYAPPVCERSEHPLFFLLNLHISLQYV